ncbi:MAG: hypothetical protein DMF56_14175 [Acidobacteria bacterium]|nr:MAG: hypothetical protein DMF56_14175 [Acidobacteriota bacterium]
MSSSFAGHCVSAKRCESRSRTSSVHASSRRSATYTFSSSAGCAAARAHWSYRSSTSPRSGCPNASKSAPSSARRSSVKRRAAKSRFARVCCRSASLTRSIQRYCSVASTPSAITSSRSKATSGRPIGRESNARATSRKTVQSGFTFLTKFLPPHEVFLSPKGDIAKQQGGLMKRIVSLILGILLVASFAVAAPPPHGPAGAAAFGPPPPPPGAPALDDYLNLTDSQKAAAQSIEADFRAQTESLHEQMRALHEQLMAARKAADAKFETILTGDQKAKFEAFIAAMEILRKGGPGGGAHP